MTASFILPLIASLVNELVYCESVGSTEQSDPLTSSSRLPLTITLVVVLLFLCLLVIVVIYKCRKKCYMTANGEAQTLEEISSMLQEVHPVDDTRSGSTPVQIGNFCYIKDNFLKQLKEKYQDLYDAVQPIPYIKDRLYCYDKVFIESGVEILVSVKEVEEGKGLWSRMNSYQNVFGDPRTKEPRRILEGDAGYGKSTIMLQFAYDWCKSNPTSALHDVDILILLQLRQLGDATSIYRAIKQLLLPVDSSLSECDIRNVMLESESVVLLLDGFDEYLYANATSDVINIIANNMFQEFEVILTTRSSFLPNVYPPSTKRLRLTGFDGKARRYYIDKAVVGNVDENVHQIDRYLQDNPILSELCQVPMFFFISAHMAYENEPFRKLNSVTGSFRYMISCFHSHTKNKLKDNDVSQYETFVIEHLELDKVAFDTLSRNGGHLMYQKEELRQQIGEEFYEQYVQTGILIEEEVVDIGDQPSAITTEYVRYKIEVRFYHKIFCEWYAAHYLSDYIDENPNVDVSELFQNLDPFDDQYTYRFACGLNPNCTKKIVNYLKKIEGGEEFAVLCILEQTGRFDQIGHTVRKICSEGIVISSHDSLLLIRSSIQLVDLAARNGILVEKLILHNCLQSIDLSAGYIRIHGSVALSSRALVKWLSIHLYTREMSEEEAIAILKFSSMCPSLNHLSFSGCVPPRSFKTGSLLSALKSRNIKVSWRWRDNQPRYILNLQSGRWEEENDGSEPEAGDFERMSSNNADERNKWTEEKYRGWVEKARGKLRNDAKKDQDDALDNGNDDGNKY